MQQFPNYSDQRQLGFCAYCGRRPDTRDHVPSRVLLDEPYPENLPIVPACVKCNQSFSADEEYLACLVECVICGSTNPDDLRRPRIKEKLATKPRLMARLSAALSHTGNGPVFAVEEERVRNVMLKLARGHALYELNEPQLDDPRHFAVVPLPLLLPTERSQFETAAHSSAWPEVGSRAMQRMLLPGLMPDWIEAQPGRYRYLAVADASVTIRVVLSEYLAGEVIW